LPLPVQSVATTLEQPCWSFYRSGTPRGHLSALLPGSTVIVFGSLTRPNAFHSSSDIDLALECEPAMITCYGLTSELMERMGRPADVILQELE
jgi:predicted nucleotidyltransferase